MMTHGRFNVFFDENQPPKGGFAGHRKEQGQWGILSEFNSVLAANALQPRDEILVFSKQPLCVNYAIEYFENQKNTQVSLLDSKIKVTEKETLEDDASEKLVHMKSPQPIDSPMITSPVPVAKTINASVQVTSEKLLDDEFFTQLYGNTHYSYLKKKEIKLRPRPDYMEKQRDVSPLMRSVLIDWLVEVNAEYKLSDETLFLAVSFIDKFLSQMSVVRSKLQLLGAAALLVASKVEDVYPPQTSQLAYITDDSFTVSQIVRMEALILKNLDFQLNGTHALTFLRNLAIQGGLSLKISHMAQYIAELSLLNINSLMFKPSEVAAASVVLAIYQINGDTVEWTPALHQYADINEDQLKAAIVFLHGLLMEANSSRYASIPIKYAQKQYSEVSHLVLNPMIPIV